MENFYSWITIFFSIRALLRRVRLCWTTESQRRPWEGTESVYTRVCPGSAASWAMFLGYWHADATEFRILQRHTTSFIEFRSRSVIYIQEFYAKQMDLVFSHLNEIYPTCFDSIRFVFPKHKYFTGAVCKEFLESRSSHSFQCLSCLIMQGKVNFASFVFFLSY